MRCHKCRGPAEEKVFTTFRYWYCGECKVEVDERAPSVTATEARQRLADYDYGSIFRYCNSAPPANAKIIYRGEDDDTRLDDGEDDDAYFGGAPNTPKDPSAADDAAQLSFDFWVNKP